MKKILYMLLCIFMLIGCTHQTGGNTDPVVTTNTPVVTIPTPKPITTTTTTTYNYPKPEYHDQIMNGDLSAILGEYIDSNGQSIYLNEGDTLNSIKYLNGIYKSSIYSPSGEGIGFFIYPEGIEVTYQQGMFDIVVETDTSKIRIAYTNAEITSKNQVYTKKEE